MSIYDVTSSLTLYSLAVSMPLTNVINPSSKAMERFKWIKCCVRLKTRFLHKCIYTHAWITCIKYTYNIKWTLP